MQFVTLELARAHLRLDTTDEDTYVEFLIQAASGAVLNYVKDSNPGFLDSSQEPYVDSNGLAEGIPVEVQSATLLLVGYLHKDRDNNGLYKASAGGNFEHGYLPRPVIGMLYRYRMPGLR